MPFLLLAARMESNGQRDCIHISSDTAELLRAAGKSSWIEPRTDIVSAKGKGLMRTFWIKIAANGSTSQNSSRGSADQGPSEDVDFVEGDRHVTVKLSKKTNRLVEWNVEMLLKLLKEIVARRNCALRNFFMMRGPNEEIFKSVDGKMVVDEIKEIIELPKFDRITAMNQQDISTIELDDEVVDQLTDYIATVAKLYNNNPCECFLFLWSSSYSRIRISHI